MAPYPGDGGLRFLPRENLRTDDDGLAEMAEHAGHYVRAIAASGPRLDEEQNTPAESTAHNAAGVSPLVRRAAGVLFLTADRHILLCRRVDNGFWSIPAGMVEDGETPAEAAAREVREETGHQVESKDLLEWTRQVRDGIDFTTFVTTVGEPFEPVLNHEHDAHQWVTLDQARGDAWDESAHPREPAGSSSGGQFTSGGGGGVTLPIAPALNIDHLSKTGNTLGTTPGGTFIDNEEKQYYVKLQDESHSKNERLAAILASLAGMKTFSYRLLNKGEKFVGLATDWQKVDKVGTDSMTPEEIKSVQKHFATFAWLANWDVAGAGPEKPSMNMGIIDGQPISLDWGGALLYRGMGEPKGDLLTDDVSEWAKFRDPKVNPSAAKLFGSMTDADLAASAENVSKITYEQIVSLVDQYGPGTTVEKVKLIDKLIARRNDIATKGKMADELAAIASIPKSASETPAKPPQPTLPPPPGNWTIKGHKYKPAHTLMTDNGFKVATKTPENTYYVGPDGQQVAITNGGVGSKGWYGWEIKTPDGKTFSGLGVVGSKYGNDLKGKLAHLAATKPAEASKPTAAPPPPESKTSTIHMEQPVGAGPKHPVEYVHNKLVGMGLKPTAVAGNDAIYSDPADPNADTYVWVDVDPPAGKKASDWSIWKDGNKVASGSGMMALGSKISKIHAEANPPSAKQAPTAKPPDHPSHYALPASKAASATISAMETLNTSAPPIHDPNTRAALVHYTGGGYAEMNRALRYGLVTLTPEMNAIQSYLSTAAFPEDRVVFRRVSSDFAEFLKGIKVGTTFVDHGFISTSIANDVWSGAATMEIRLPKGSMAAAVQHLASHKTEYEVLLQRGTHLKVVGMRGAGHLICEVEQTHLKQTQTELPMAA